jgi:hypothetical protein
MEKLVYLLWKRDDEAIDAFRARLLGDVAPKLVAEGALALVANVADLHDRLPANGPLVAGEGRTLAASVSLWVESQDLRASFEPTLSGVASRLWGYLVTESVPLRCPDRRWADGERSPGVTLWTAFPKPDRIDDAAFFARWYGSHTPLSFEVHPLWQYVRNAVARPLTPGAAPYRAIVEERFRTLDEILDLRRFFGGDLANVKRVMDDLATFTEMATMNTTPMSEYIVKTEPWVGR